jgi:hypothetical protein
LTGTLSARKEKADMFKQGIDAARAKGEGCMIRRSDHEYRLLDGMPFQRKGHCDEQEVAVERYGERGQTWQSFLGTNAYCY